MRTMTRIADILPAGMLPHFEMPRPVGRPVFQPRRKKLKGWQKEMRRNNPNRFFKGKKKK